MLRPTPIFIKMNDNRLHLDSSGEEVKEKMKEHIVSLRDEDLNHKPGKEEVLLERLKKKLILSKEGVKAPMESVSANRGMAS